MKERLLISICFPIGDPMIRHLVRYLRPDKTTSHMSRIGPRPYLEQVRRCRQFEAVVDRGAEREAMPTREPDTWDTLSWRSRWVPSLTSSLLSRSRAPVTRRFSFAFEVAKVVEHARTVVDGVVVLALDAAFVPIPVDTDRNRGECHSC
jgi:hypothetical protein